MLALCSVLVAVHGGPFPGEVGLLEAANGLPRMVGVPLEAVMELGTLGVALIVVAVVAVFTAPSGIRPTCTVLLAVVVAYPLQRALKEVFERARPGVILQSIDVREPVGGFAFPSGHATVAFALASSISLLVPGRWRWVPFGLATCVAVARMYVGAHWPVDVLGGAALGTAVGTSAWLIVDSLGRPRETRPS